MSNDRSSARLLVAGELRETAGQQPVVNPATSAPVGDSPVAEADLVDEAVRAAHAAFRDWAALPVPARTAYLTRFAAWVREHVDPIARTLTAAQGKPLSESIGEVKAVATAFDYYASAAPHVLSETIPTASPTLRSTVLRQPSGVVGAALAAHPLVRHLTFTGGTGTGKNLMRVAADTLKRLTLELGGGSPLIVVADAPLERAVADGVEAGVPQQRPAVQLGPADLRGGVCRRRVHRAVRQGCRRHADRPGDAEPEPDMGPMCGEAALQHVIDLIEDARAAGASVLIVGQRLTGPEYDGGWYFPPTGVTDTVRISSEEVFGPVAAAKAFRSPRWSLMRCRFRRRRRLLRPSGAMRSRSC